MRVGVRVGDGVGVSVGNGVTVAVGIGEGERVAVPVGVGTTATGKGVGVARATRHAHPPARQAIARQTTVRPNAPASTRLWAELNSRGSAAVTNERRDTSTGASGVGSPS